METPLPTSHDISLAPLGAGDLVDRAVRFYRGNFWTFLFMAAPPVIAASVITVVWRFAGREVFGVGAGGDQIELTFYYLYLWAGSIVIWFIETVATLVVMGGASRNFVQHLLFGEPITFRSTYRNAWSRLAGLVAASALITIILGIAGIFFFYIGVLLAGLAIFFAAVTFESVPVVAFVISLVASLAVIGGSLWLFFLVASRFAYVPQVMLVEGHDVFAAIGRSATLASGNVKRLAALFIFSTVATYSALALFYVPLGWYAWVNGVQVFGGNPDLIPAWYEIASQLIGQASLILLSPVWMIGLCLLYVDERVRHEGYDIELMAARRLGEIPSVPSEYINPLQPAMASQLDKELSREQKDSPFTTLGLGG